MLLAKGTAWPCPQCMAYEGLPQVALEEGEVAPPPPPLSR